MEVTFVVGSMALLSSRIFQILDVAAQLLIRPAFTAYVSTFPGPVLQEKDFLIFISTHQSYYYILFYSEALAATLGLFGVLAVFVILRHYDKGFALVASALAITGIGILISGIPNHPLPDPGSDKPTLGDALHAPQKRYQVPLRLSPPTSGILYWFFGWSLLQLSCLAY